MYGSIALVFLPLVGLLVVAKHENGRTGIFWLAFAISLIAVVAAGWLNVQWQAASGICSRNASRRTNPPQVTYMGGSELRGGSVARTCRLRHERVVLQSSVK
jgi:hypothetical protein